MKPADNRVVVVGAGVIGLSCAVLLAEAGYDTHVLARELPRETYSAHGAGLWLPQLLGPAHKLGRWAGQTYAALCEFVGVRGAGVELREGTLLRQEAGVPPSWSRWLDEVVDLQAHDRPAPGYPGGYRLTVPVVDMPRYLDHLTHRLAEAGGILTRMPLPALPERGLVLNCTGVAARALARDWSVHPVRGQLAVVPNPGISGWSVDEDAALFIVPQGDRVVVGATHDVDEWDTTPQPDVSTDLVRRAAEIEPALSGAQILSHRVGLWPLRDQVRLEVVPGGRTSPERVLVHCYGHARAGLTLSWGCAREVLHRVEELEPTLF